MIVSSLIIQRNFATSHSIENYIIEFKVLCDTLNTLNIPITLYLDRRIALPYEYDNLEIRPISIEDLSVYHLMKNFSNIMVADNPRKNTLDYHIINHAKVELCNRVAQGNVNLERISWVDFGITHFMKDPIKCISKLKNLPELPKGIYIPGSFQNSNVFLDYPNWRYSGSFFSGDPESLETMFSYLRTAVNNNAPVATWEVNTNSYMETILDWKPNWYYGTHNDSIFDFKV